MLVEVVVTVVAVGVAVGQEFVIAYRAASVRRGGIVVEGRAEGMLNVGEWCGQNGLEEWWVALVLWGQYEWW